MLRNLFESMVFVSRCKEYDRQRNERAVVEMLKIILTLQSMPSLLNMCPRYQKRSAKYLYDITIIRRWNQPQFLKRFCSTPNRIPSRFVEDRKNFSTCSRFVTDPAVLNNLPPPNIIYRKKNRVLFFSKK